MAVSESRIFVLRFTLPNSAHPADVVAWIGQMLFTHSGVKVSIEPVSPVDGFETYEVVSAGEADDEAGLVRLAWHDNSVDWRDTGAQICS